jgi:putative transposase
MADPKNRGARDILIACCDGLAGFGDAIAGAFPRTVVRRCVVRYGGLPVVPASLRELVAVVASRGKAGIIGMARSALTSSVPRKRKVAITGKSSVAGLG